MSLTFGSGPFGTSPAGRFNLEVPREGLVYVEALDRWIRARRGDETVVDSTRPRLAHEHGKLPVFWFPAEDVRLDLVPPEMVERSDLDMLEGLVSVRWDAADEWLDEDEPLLGHARDPYSRIDVRKTSRRVRISLNGEVLAETTRAKVLYEAGLRPRWYIPEEDVRMEALQPTDHRTTCAYKGHASYWSVGDEENVVWTYREPLHDALPVKDMLCFYDERVELEVERQESPTTRPASLSP